MSTVATAALPGLLRSALARPGSFIVLSGAGISAESGVPTFRGKDGYWVIGSRNYHAQELATRAAFSRMPESVWGWYLHRLRVCRNAQPNPAHVAGTRPGRVNALIRRRAAAKAPSART